MNGSAESSVASSAQRANDRLANMSTPLIHNCWYMAGWGSDFTRNLCERILLGRSLVFYRCLDGCLVAMQNRCPHRSFPLVHGTLEGDILRCGYHGLTYDATGACTEIPSQNVIPRTVCARVYPVVECGPVVWIWMGDPSQADTSRIPATPWLGSPGWRFAAGQLSLRASYVYLHENLLDLSHFTFLHPTTLGTPEYARAPFEAQVGEQVVLISRFIERCDVPPMYRSTGITGKMSRRTVSEFVSPAVHRASVVLSDLQPTAGARRDFTAHITHFTTPQTQDTTHYWFTFARDFALDDDAVTAEFLDNAMTAFAEDQHALEESARIYALEPDAPRNEIHLKSDHAGVAARRILRRMAEGVE